MNATKQNGFTIVAPVLDGHEPALRELLLRMGADPNRNGILDLDTYPGLHFAATVLIQVDDSWRLLIEGNVDGPSSEFLTRFGRDRSAGLDQVFAHCVGYPPGKPAEYLTSHDLGPGSLYVGCPGRSVEQILAEQKLRQAIEGYMGDRPDHRDRAEILSYVRDHGLDLGAYTPPWLVRYGDPTLWILAGLSIGLVVIAFILSWLFSLAVLVLLFVLLVLGYIHLRQLEIFDKPFPNQRFSPEAQQVVEREDFGAANHMTSVTRVKPGWFRGILLRTVLWFVRLVVRFQANKGQLSGIPSIYFARWIIVEKSTLVFLSNFGGSWDSYLNDFIDQASAGLTAIWSNSVGFPRARNLVEEGARDELGFKVYARNSQVPNLVWYQAYPELTTSNIDNNTEIRQGPYDKAGEERWIRRF